MLSYKRHHAVTDYLLDNKPQASEAQGFRTRYLIRSGLLESLHIGFDQESGEFSFDFSTEVLAVGNAKTSIFGKSFSGGSFSVSNEKLPPENHYLPTNYAEDRERSLSFGMPILRRRGGFGLHVIIGTRLMGRHLGHALRGIVRRIMRLGFGFGLWGLS